MYQVDVFTNGLIYKETINPRDIIGDFSFSGNINSSMGPITISVNKPFGDMTYGNGDIVQVVAIDENNKAGKLAYGGVITAVRRIADSTKEYIELDCLGYSQLMQFTAILNLDTNDRPPQDIVSDIIDYMNTKYPGYFSIESIDLTHPNISYFLPEYSNALSHIQAITDATGRKRYIGQEGGLKMGTKPITYTHLLTYAEDVSELQQEEDGTNIINKAVVQRSDTSSTLPGPFNQTFETVEDLASIGQYGERARYFPGEIRVLDDTGRLVFYGPIGLASAQSFGQSKLVLQPERATTVKVNDLYDYFSITPFDTVSIQGIDFEIENLQVVKVTYQKGSATLELEKLENLGTLGNSLVFKR